MGCIKRLFWNYNLYRCICGSSVNNNIESAAKFMNKFLSGGSKKRSKWYNEPNVIPSIINNNKPIKIYHRRIHLLNKLFMKHITDLLATGEISSELVGKGLEISHVSITRDYKLINIFWYTRKDTEIIEKLLKKCTGPLRHELSQLKLIGVVPPIQFVKNKKMFQADQVEAILSTLGLSDDNEQTVKNKENTNETTVLENEDVYNVVVPEMTHNIFNVNHATIMKKIKNSMKKTQNTEKRRSNSKIPKEESQLINPSNVIEYLEMKHDPNLFSQFLKKRSIDQRRKKLASINLYLQDETYNMESRDDDVEENFETFEKDSSDSDKY